MIEEPPLLTIAGGRNRPSPGQVSALSRYPTGFIADAMNGSGALDASIRPVGEPVLPVKLCGPVLTCDNGPADILATLAAITELEKGDVLVAATGGWKQCAAAGDRVIGMIKNAGGAGFVSDGLVRDIEGIREVGIPVFCCGLTPNSPYANGPGTVGLPVVVGGVNVCSGDLLVSDENGAIVVPYPEIDKVLEKLKTVERLEAELDAEIQAGLVVPDAITELVNSDKVKRVQF